MDSPLPMALACRGLCQTRCAKCEISGLSNTAETLRPRFGKAAIGDVIGCGPVTVKPSRAMTAGRFVPRAERMAS